MTQLGATGVARSWPLHRIGSVVHGQSLSGLGHGGEDDFARPRLAFGAQFLGGLVDAAVIFGAYESSSKSLRTMVVPDTSAQSLGEALSKCIDWRETELHSDEHRPYLALGPRCKVHRHVCHKREYVTVDGVHNNAVENAWSLFARSVMGSFHQISVKHLPRYLGEFDARFNARHENGTFFDRIIRQGMTRRLSMAELVAEPASDQDGGAASR